MARKSGWQEFAENFNSTFEIGNKIQQGIATSKVMNDEKFTGEGGAGYGLSGNELEKARYKALGDIYTKYGDPEKGLGFRTQLANLEDKERQNLMDENTRSFREELLGKIARDQGLANVNQTNSTTNLNTARTAEINATYPVKNDLTRAQTAGVQMDTLSTRKKLDGEIKLLESQFVKNMESAGLSASQANQIDTLLQGKVDLNEANIDNVIAGTGLKGEQAAELKALLAGKIAQQASTLRFTDSKSDTNEQMLPANLGLANAKIGFTKAQADGVEANTLAQNLSNNATQTAQDNTALEADLLAQVNNKEYANANGITTPEQAQSAFLKLVKTSNLPLERQLAIEQTVNKFGLAELQGEATKLAANAKAAMAKGGLDGLTAWYDKVDDPTDGEPTTLRVLRENGEVKVLRKVGEQESVLFSAAGEGAEGQVGDFMMNQITNPGTSMTVAASVLEMAKTKASTDSTKTQTDYQEIVNDNQRLKQELQNGNIQANNDLAVAQTMKLKQDAIANSGLTWNKEAAQKSYNSFITSENFEYVREKIMDGENPEQNLKLYTNQIKYGLNIIPEKPKSVKTLDEWLMMTDRDRELFPK
jgi:hypothetical protein